jgi:hypothetical protein
MSYNNYLCMVSSYTSQMLPLNQLRTTALGMLISAGFWVQTDLSFYLWDIRHFREEWIISSVSPLGATRPSPCRKLNDIIARNGYVYLSLSRLLHAFHVRLKALQRTDFTISGYQACHGWVEAQCFGVPLSPPSEDMWKGSVSPWNT